MTPPTSKALAVLSSQAYQTATLKADNTEVLIKDFPDCLVLAFRGTTFDGKDIIRDLRAVPWWSDEVRGFAHRGFLVGVRAILPLLPLTRMSRRPVVLTGHSKGGAEAILTGAFLTHLGHPPVKIETFGAPRVGFGWIEETLKGIPGHRYRLGRDIVPTVPHPFPFPYRHDRDLMPLVADDRHSFRNHRIADYVAAV